MPNPVSVLLALLLAASALAQVSTSRLEGLVQDSSGAVVPTARIIAVHNRTAVSTIVSSDPEGSFVFLSLPPGEYTLTVDKSGFRKFVLTGVALNVAATLVENIELELGPVTDAVTVQAKEATVQNSDSQVGRVVSLRDIDVLPQLERNPITLAIFQPGVQIRGGDIGNSRINGTRPGSNSVRVDGINATETVNPALSFSANLTTTDSVEEFRIITNGGKAEYGSHAGAQIEMITRTGTNRWSGNAFDYLRNTALNANDFFNNSSSIGRPKFIQNVFGGSLGGPLVRNRTFVFGSFQGTRSRQEVVRNRNVLTPSARAGVFRWKPPGSAAIQEFDIVRNDPRSKGIDPQIAALIKLLPEPNNLDSNGSDGLNTGGFRFNSPSNSTADGFTIRGDHNIGHAVRLFFRVSSLHVDYIDSINGADAPFPGQLPGTTRVRVAGYSIGSDWAVNPRMVNELRFGRNGAPRELLRPARVAGPMLVANSWTSPVSTQFAQGIGATTHELTDNLSTVRGSHFWKIGLNLRLTSQSSYNEAGIYPDVSFGRTSGNIPAASVGPTGNISTADRVRFELLYNDLLGRMERVNQTFYSDLGQFQAPGVARARNFRSRDYGVFVQDDWKVRRNLTLNLGLRYEFSGVPSERDRLQGTLDKATQIDIAGRSADLTLVRSNRWYDNDYNNLAQRLGLAWDPRGDGKTAVRAQYGIYYDGLIGATTNFVDINTPGFSQNSGVFPNEAGSTSDQRVSDGIPLPSRPAAPLLQQPNARQSTIALFSPHLRTGYLQTYSLTLQRELFRNTVIEAGLVGNRGVKLFMQVNPNQLRIGDGFLQAFREIQAFRSNGSPVPAADTLVRLFGSVNGAISSIGASTFYEGAVSAAADTPLKAAK